MPTKSEIKGRLMIKLTDGNYVEIPEVISLEEAETMAEQYEFVRVVRCRDCKHYEPSKPGWNVWGRCLLYAHDDLCNCVDYCSWAERREDETND